MEVSVGALTVIPVDPDVVPRVALIVVDPVATAVADPVLSIDTTEVSADAHVTCALMSWELPSLRVPVAVNCCVVSTTSEVSAGSTAMEVKIGLTVRLFEPLTVPMDALIVVVPALRAVAKPELLIVATLLELELHVAFAVRSLLLPSL
jgi:hypothetical protein